MRYYFGKKVSGKLLDKIEDLFLKYRVPNWDNIANRDTNFSLKRFFKVYHSNCFVFEITRFYLNNINAFHFNYQVLQFSKIKPNAELKLINTFDELKKFIKYYNKYGFYP